MENKITIVIKLESIEAVLIKDVDGKRQAVPELAADKQQTYFRHDLISLQNLLGRYDTRQHPVQEWPTWAIVKQKLYQVYALQKDLLELTVAEAMFVQKFFKELPEKEALNVPLKDGDVMARESALNQIKNGLDALEGK